MKPHEEKWTTGGGEHGGREVRVEGGSTVAFCPGSDAEAQETARFIAAAPDMARVLLLLGSEGRYGWHLDSCGGVACDFDCEEVQAVLRKAGVLP